MPPSISKHGAAGLTFEEIPQGPVKTARCTVEKLVMLASARRNRLTDAGWATLGGFLASLPATAQDVWKAYCAVDATTGLDIGGLIDVSVTLIFLGSFVATLFAERGDTAKKLLHEILNPNGPPYQAPAKWRFWE